jgi:hypothetical protein
MFTDQARLFVGGAFGQHGRAGGLDFVEKLRWSVYGRTLL